MFKEAITACRLEEQGGSEHPSPSARDARR